ncbi:hypothetical protein [Aquimarina algicola]|uniref:Uncharacterized protein n=1 Tax=Aquimarina algicola TaxID=2589995 RepID=A0A504JJT5_9FLAO|nr:hypothetical protein [Aquimarina algicola]TPN89062.1 hypothetical protein FHK87_02250 [Aquimarina algicola]
MRTLTILTNVVCMTCFLFTHAQADSSNTKNSSTEVVTKIIRIKGPNGEEKVITKKEVITKKSKIELNPEDENKTNQSATYSDEEVQIEKSSDSSADQTYTKVADENGFTMTFSDKSKDNTFKVRPINKEYYIVSLDNNNNFFGYFDTENNFIIETYDHKIDKVITTIYKEVKSTEEEQTNE